MKVVYKSSIINEIINLSQEFTVNHGFKPNLLELTKIEWEALKNEIRKHSIYFENEHDPRSCMILGLLIEVKG